MFEINDGFVKGGKRAFETRGGGGKSRWNRNGNSKGRELRNSTGDNVAMRSNRISTHRHTPYMLGIHLAVPSYIYIYIFYTMFSRRFKRAIQVNLSIALHVVVEQHDVINPTNHNKYKKLGNFLVY